MIGWWLEFPFWQSVAICILGGVLGVTFSIPLRRTLVVQGGLPYPEGVAAAEVLKVGSPGAEQTEEAVRENKSGLFVVVGGAIASAFTLMCLGAGGAQVWWLTSVTVTAIAFTAVVRGQFKTTRPKARLTMPPAPGGGVTP